MRWLAILVVAACNVPPTRFHRVELPGFSFEAPLYVQATRDLRYSDDELDVDRSIQRINISWQIGEILTPAAIDSLPDGSGAPDLEDVTWGTGRSVTIGGQTASELDGKVDSLDAITIADITCGRRSVMITLAGLGIGAIRDRMFESFTCKPIAAEEAALGTAKSADEPAPPPEPRPGK